MGTRGSFPGVKRPGGEADHSPPSSAEVKNAWSYTFTPPTRLQGVVLRDEEVINDNSDCIKISEGPHGKFRSLIILALNVPAKSQTSFFQCSIKNSHPNLWPHVSNFYVSANLNRSMKEQQANYIRI
jgi:hypothetical protein